MTSSSGKNIPAVDLEWLARMLGRDEAAIVAADWSPVGTGQVADSFRGRLLWKGEAGPETIIMKCPSSDPTSRETGINFGLYDKELSWYAALAPKTDINCPKYYGSQLDEKTGDFRLILQDCAPASQGDQIRGASLEDVRKGIAELALLHAPFFNNQAIVANELTCRNPESTKLRVDLYADCWPKFRDRYKDRLDAEILAMGDYFVRKFEQYAFRRSEDFSLIHGDFRIDNLLFGGKNDRVFVLDWQTIVEDCPMKDVAYFVGTSFADPAQRKAYEEGLLQEYFAILKLSGIAANEDALRKEYKLQALAGVVMAVFSSMLVERTERGDEMFAVMAERPGYQALELDSVSLI
jgi:hypothetical protein